MAHALMSQTMNRLKKLSPEWSSEGAHPPDLTRFDKLSYRHQRIFEFWQATGLGPRSLKALRTELITSQFGSDFVQIRVPVIKINPTPGEMFVAKAPKATYDPSFLPITDDDTRVITSTLNATLYGPRRALAICLRLHAVGLDITPKLQSGKISPQFVNFAQQVSAWMGWSRTSKMWTSVYSEDALSTWSKTTFMVHPLVRALFTNFITWVPGKKPTKKPTKKAIQN
eukprot:g5605.t1